jgi:FkbM family methyltransferase
MTPGIDRLSICTRVLRWLPPGLPGKARLARALLGASRKKEDCWIATPEGCAYRVPSLMEPVAFHLLVDGVYEPELARFIVKRLPAGGTFVDVGANVGAFTIPAAKRVGPSGTVLAVEASPRVFPFLEENVRTNRAGNVRLKYCAASDCDSAGVPFYEAPADHFGMGSMAPQFGARPVLVPSRPLNQLLAEEGLSHVDILKVDVEGFEAQVFPGARGLLTSDRPPVVVFEFCDWAEERADGRTGLAQQVLRDFGYDLFLLKGPALVPTGLVTAGFETMVAVRPAR